MVAPTTPASDRGNHTQDSASPAHASYWWTEIDATETVSHQGPERLGNATEPLSTGLVNVGVVTSRVSVSDAWTSRHATEPRGQPAEMSPTIFAGLDSFALHVVVGHQSLEVLCSEPLREVDKLVRRCLE